MKNEIQNSHLPAIDFSSDTALIADLKKQYADLPEVTDEKTRKVVTAAIGDFKKLRAAIEKKRKELKAESLEWQRTLDSKAKEATEAVSEIEQQLLALRQPYDDAKEEEERAKIEELQRIEDARIQAIKDDEERLAKERAEMEAARLKMEEERRKFEEEKNRAEFERQALEQARIKAEQERIEKERFAEQERKRLEAENIEAAKAAEAARVKAEQDRIEQIKREEQERLAEIELKHKAELARIEAERLAKERAEREEKERLAAIKAEEERQRLLMPEKEKMLEFARLLSNLEVPEIKDADLKAVLDLVLDKISKSVDYIKKNVEK